MLKRIILIILIDLIILVATYTCGMDYPYLTLNDNTRIYEYEQKTTITDLNNNIFVNYLKQKTNLYNNENINMKNTVKEGISINTRRYRTSAGYILLGTYSNLDDLKNSLSMLDIDETEFHSSSSLMLSNNEDPINVNLWINGDNSFVITFSFYISRYGEQVAEDSIYLDYFMEMNTKNSENIRNEIKQKWEKVIISIILIDILIWTICYFIHKRRKKQAK